MGWFEDAINKANPFSEENKNTVWGQINNPKNIATAVSPVNAILYDQTIGKNKREEKQRAQNEQTIQAARTRGEQVARDLFGQSNMQTGQDIQDLKGRLQSRVEGTDPISEAIRASKSGAVANVGREMSGRGVAGGISAAAKTQAARSKDMDIAASLFHQQRAALQDYGGLLGTFASQAPAIEMGYENVNLAGRRPDRGGGLLGFLGL